MPIEAVEPYRLYRQVADQLRMLIDRGEFAAGSRLPAERDLALQLGISRPTVREALIALEVDGRIRIRVGSGIYVLPPKSRRPEPQTAVAGSFDILAARSLFEGAAAREAAASATPAHVARLDAIIARMGDVRHPGVESIVVDRAFHVAVADILANEAVTRVVGELFDQRFNPHFARLAQHFENAGSWKAAQAEHVAIRDALAARDPAAAAAAMHDHLRRSQARFSETFGEPSSGFPAQPGSRKPGHPRLRATAARLTQPIDSLKRRKQP
jgi:DNA-binding FadR family transcriptional regulator